MSFGGGGFGGGFGSTNNQSTTFGSGGGFGANNNTSTGFGTNQNTGSSMFGQSNNTGGSIFGNNSGSSSTFGGGGGGFGSNTNTTFGSKPFGSGSTGGLFGGTGASGTTFGGFGSTANNTTATSTFGSGGTGGGLFGQAKPTTTFGGGGTTGGGLFGGASTTGGFGQTNTSGGFGTSTTSSPFGANNQQTQQNQPNNGTGSTPFQAFNEKDASGQQQFQTITFQQPYQNHSLEELRLVDYNQGRKYGNQNGQAGAFGQSTGFGGFGSTQNASTGFGSTANTNTGGGLFGGSGTGTGTTFGQGNTTTTFGSTPANTGGGLFGANKPSGGLFGSTATSQPASGGLFGSSNTNTGGFGSGNTGTGFGSSATSGGGLFGQQNQTQAKPAFGFGSNTNTNTNTGGGLFGGGSTGGGFGQSNTNTGGGLFGQQNQSSAPAFGAAQPTTGTTGGLFGGGNSSFGQNQNQTQNQPSGGLFGSGGFGQNNQNQQKPAGGLFGNTGTGTTGGGLFGGNTQTQQTGGGLFGNTNTQNQTGGLFGAKPATGGGLFGNTNNNAGASTGGGLFGNIGQNNQQSSGTGLFGQSNQQKPAGGLFGSSQPAANTGGGLFGNLNTSTNNNSGGLGGSLFGGSQTQQQPQQPPLNNSLFGASGGSLLNTSMNTNPYGNDALFAGLATPSQSPGPLATPLSSSQKNRKSAILPQHKLNPSASTRLLTPQNRKIGGYGFTYSTYGTPNSASSASSPGYSTNFFSPGSLTRSLGKSLSTSNLRNSFTPDTSILAPGAFSTNGRSFAGGSLKKLNINRNIQARPLFDDPTPVPKRVSFAGTANGNDPVTSNGASLNGTTDNQIVLREEAENASPGEGSSRTSSTVNGEVNGTTPAPRRPEMEQVNRGDLTPVPEQNALGPRSTSSLNAQQGPPEQDPTPGAYWSQPSMEQLRKMSPDQLKAVPNFVVGRKQVGKIEFNNGQPVDLTGINLDKLFGDIIVLTHRNASVYSGGCTQPKVPDGTKINVPSRVILENSWPRRAKHERFKKSGLSQSKHIERLKRVGGTQFENYNSDTGVWIFTVPHFSSYGFDYDDYEDEDESSELSSAPDTPAQAPSAQVPSSQLTATPQEDSPISLTQSSPDDTFDFKKGKRKRASVPGGFGDEVAYEEEEDGDVSMNTAGESFLGQRSVGSLDGQDDHEESESGSVVDQNMAGSISGPVHTTGHLTAKEADLFKDSIKPKSILKATQPLRPAFGTPSKGQLVFDDDWANQLQRTISPRKQDRHALRETQSEALRERDANETSLAQSFTGSVIATKMDLMNSLFGTSGKGKDLAKKRVGTGIELPYAKRPKSSNDLNDLSESDRAFHSCNKPHFSENGILVYANHGPSNLEGGSFKTALQPIVGAHQDIRFARLPAFLDAVPSTLEPQKKHTKFSTEDGAPFAAIGRYFKENTMDSLDFSAVAAAVDITTTAGRHEKQIWDLLAILFDENDLSPPDMSHDLIDQHKERFRKDKLSEFWRELVSADAQQHAQEANTAEEKAIAHLSGHDVPDACLALLNGLDLRLSTMVSQIPGDLVMRRDMISQIEEWRQLDVLSEIDESVRALYELLAGNCAQSDGKGDSGRENKASTFHIAERFGLDWRRAFGLRLWYGTLVDEPIEMAVAQFADALRDGKEHIKPLPWFTEERVDMGWADQQAEQREDILWGILKLYASSKMDLPVNIEEVIAPENVSGHPLHARLSWQLFQLFKSRHEDSEEADERRVSLPTLRSSEADQSFISSASSQVGDEQAEDPLTELGDKLTLTYAASLHTIEHWTTAAYVYTHLSSANMREHYIRSLLVQFSKNYTIAEDDKTYSYLIELRIPETWMHAAAALQAKTEGDDVRQTLHLIKAEELEEAHEVLCRSVGPYAIIARDYDALRELLGDFVPTPTSTPITSRRRAARPKDPVPGWAQGGQIYFDYIHLLDLTSTRDTTHRADEELDKEIGALVTKLQHALESLSRDRWDQRGLEERVALSEIAGIVAGQVAKGKHSERARVLKLPLTEDLWLRHTTNLSSDYYRAVVAGARL